VILAALRTNHEPSLRSLLQTCRFAHHLITHATRPPPLAGLCAVQAAPGNGGGSGGGSGSGGAMTTPTKAGGGGGGGGGGGAVSPAASHVAVTGGGSVVASVHTGHVLHFASALRLACQATPAREEHRGKRS